MMILKGRFFIVFTDLSLTAYLKIKAGFDTIKDFSARRFLSDENGLGTVEIVLILAVLVGIALIFRTYIFGFVAEIMENIMGGSTEGIRSNPLNE